MKYLAILIALIAMPALAEENRYTRINLDFGKEGAYYHYADRGYCQTKICLVKMTSAKMVLDYGISDATPKVKKKADPKDNQPPSNLPPGT